MNRKKSERELKNMAENEGSCMVRNKFLAIEKSAEADGEVSRNVEGKTVFPTKLYIQT